MLERLGSQGKFALCGIGIFVCYFYYGILQEKITRGKYGEGEAEERVQWRPGDRWLRQELFLYPSFL